MAGPSAREIPSICEVLCESQFPVRMEVILGKPMNNLSRKETRLLLDHLRAGLLGSVSTPSTELLKVMRELDFHVARAGRGMLSIGPMHPT